MIPFLLTFSLSRQPTSLNSLYLLHNLYYYSIDQNLIPPLIPGHIFT
jgi:hypothetical protein